MKKLFISYRSLDSAKVDMLIARLRSLQDANQQPLYGAWQDKDSIPSGQDWWQAIVDGIIECDYFVFMVSHESAQNKNCRAELSYARKRNRPIIPLVLEGEFTYNATTGKNDIGYWEAVPEELNDLRAQFLFYEGVKFVQQLATSIQAFEREPQRWRDTPADRPSDPRHASDATNNSAAIYDDACDYALRLEFTQAEKLFLRLVNANDPHFGDDAFTWISILREYQTMVMFDTKESTRYKVEPLWKKYSTCFPLPFIELYDPKDFRSRYDRAAPVSINISPVLTAEEWFNKGLVAVDWDEKIHCYTEAIHLNPDYAEAYNNRGLAYHNKGEFDRAIADYNAALQLKPDYVDAYNNRGLVYMDGKKEYDRAIADYNAALQLKPDYANAYYNRGLVYYHKREYDHAIADNTKAIRLKPDYVIAYISRSLAYKNKGESDCAIADNTEAIRLKPDYVDAYINRGNVYMDGKKDYDRAIVDNTEAIRLKPDYAIAYNNRGWVYYLKGEYNLAIADFEVALRLKPDYQIVRNNLELARKKVAGQ